jgi:hypothetical protein
VILPILLIVIAVFLVLGSVLTISSVGKPRTPMTGGVAALATLIQAGIITVLILTAIELWR